MPALCFGLQDDHQYDLDVQNLVSLDFCDGC
jgi:hypothetical protein